MLFRSAVSPTFFNNTYRKSRVNFHDNSYSLFAFNPGWEKSGFEHLSRTVLSRFDADYKDNLKTLLLLFFTNILDCSQPDCGLRCRPFEVTCFFTADSGELGSLFVRTILAIVTSRRESRATSRSFRKWRRCHFQMPLLKLVFLDTDAPKWFLSQ